MSINVKKYIKDQMAKMVEDAQAEVQELKRGNATLTEQISQMNGEGITRENVIANLKADADALRNKLADTEAALGRSMLCQEYFERPWVMKNVTLCVQYQSSDGIIFYMGYDVFRGLVERGRITPLSPEGEETLEART